MRVALLLGGLCIAHLGVTLFLQTELGSDPFNVFVQGLFRGAPWPAWAAMTHGRVHLLVSLLILLVLLGLDRSYVGVGTVLCMALGGPIIDVFTLWLSPVIHGGLPLMGRLGLLVAGCLILAVGITIEVAPDTLVVPGEGIVRALSRVTGKPFGTMKVYFDVTLIVIAVALSFLFFGKLNGIGIGTVISALTVGKFVNIVERHFPLLSYIRSLKEQPEEQQAAGI